jgi:hypothetical protein
MTELPQPDLMDRAGRLRRLVVALIVGAAVGAAAWAITNEMAKPDEVSAAKQLGESTVPQGGGAYKFVWYMTAFFGAAAFGITLAIANQLAKKKYDRELAPPAKQIR